MKTTLRRRLLGAVAGTLVAASAFSGLSVATAPDAKAWGPYDSIRDTIFAKADGSADFIRNQAFLTVPKPLYDRYLAMKNSGSVPGWPTGTAFTLRDGGIGQRFDFTTIYWSPASGAWNVEGDVFAAWGRTGYENGGLGYPTSAAWFVGNQAMTQRFQNGNIYNSARYGAKDVRGAIFAKYGQFGYENGRLGLPTTGEIAIRGGAFNRFVGGNVYWSPQGGAHPVFGALFDKWGQTGWEGGVMGYPTTDEFGPLLRGGYGQHFMGGSLYWSSQSGAHTVRGAIRDTWAARGWEGGQLGYPTSDEYNVTGGVRQNFQGGTLTYTFATGQTS